MHIVSIKDRRVKAIANDPNCTRVKGFRPAEVRKVAEMITAIRVMTHPLELRAIPAWRAHELKPGRPNVWSLWVTPNFRLTFLVDLNRQEVSLLDLEDYH